VGPVPRCRTCALTRRPRGSTGRARYTQGFRGKGFHEKKQIARAAPDDDSAAPTPPQRPKRPRDEVTAIALLAEAAEGAGQRLARSLANTDGPPPTLLHSTATPPPPPPPPASPVRAVRPARN